MKSLVELSVLLLQDLGRKCGANPNRDIESVTERTKNEGDSFLTITLPLFCQGFERCLDEGRCSPAHFPLFRRRKGTCYPKFLSGFMERIFGPDGVLKQGADGHCILSIRQFCLFAKKVRLPCSDARVKRAGQDFLLIEAGLRDQSRYKNEVRHAFKGVSRLVWSDLLRGVPYGDPFSELRPRHGPGTTREGIRGNAKYAFPMWPSRLECLFPLSEFGCGSIRNYDGWIPDYPVTVPAPRDEPPVKVAFVPKTLKTPRVIAIEPVSMQYCQQSLSDWLRPRIEHLSRYTRGRVNFTDQSVNANLALASSKDGRYATIDLSEASDRVSCLHVGDMLRAVPSFRRYVFACRSTRAELPGGDIISLRKFASMGSALCFPMESMVFFCAIVSIRVSKAGVRISPRSVLKYSQGVYVYGDDIIVPADEAPSICEGLQAFGLKINTAKSFWTGKFRESCGSDCYDGESVKPVYLREAIPTDRAQTNEIVSWVSLANQLYWAGLWGTCRAVRRHVERLVGQLPSVSMQSGMIGWQSLSQAQSFNGWHQDYQRLKLRSLVPVPVRRDDPLEGDPALLKCFILLRNKPSFVLDILPRDDDHLLRTVRYGNLTLKRRWTPV